MVVVKKQLLLVFVVYLFLFGCATTQPSARLGISDLEWSSYSQEKQKSLLADHDKVINNRKNMGKHGVGNASLEISMYDGKIMFPPSFITWQDYKPVKFDIFAGQCRDVELEHKSNKDSKTELGVCFYDNILHIDPSRYDLTKKHGSASIHSSPLWLDGFAYKGVNSNGYVRLSNVTVFVKQKVADVVLLK